MLSLSSIELNRTSVGEDLVSSTDRIFKDHVAVRGASVENNLSDARICIVLSSYQKLSSSHENDLGLEDVFRTVVFESKYSIDF